MTIFGFLATIIICGTVVGLAFLFSKKPITFKVIRANEVQMIEAPRPEVTTETKEEKIPEINLLATASMDNVIKAANELMGIASIEKEETDGRQG